MSRKYLASTSALCAAVLVLAACGGDDEEGGAGTGGSDSGPLKIGVLNSISGAASAGFAGFRPAVEARLQAYQEAGGECADVEFELVDGDDQSTPQGALAAAQRLVEQEEVFAILNNSSFMFGAAPYLTTQAMDTPVIGGGIDGGPAWFEEANANLFPAPAAINPDAAYSTLGDYFASVGATKVAGVSYEVPSSSGATLAALAAAEAAGLERGYVNTSLPFGSTDVGPIVLGIMESGSDAVIVTSIQTTALAVADGLRQANYPVKSIVTYTGYGADLLASPPAVEAAQGVSFVSATAPVELDTPATEELSSALMEYAGSESGIPTYAETQGWLAADLLLHGLELAGCDASQTELISALDEDDTYDAAGLLPTALDFTQPGGGPRNQCLYVVTLQGEEFVPNPDASPVCGEPIE